jgi:C4-dicarboxylate-specific signal transduction histidine kinase
MDAIIDLDEIIKLSKNLNVLYVEDDKSILEKTSELLNNIFNDVDVATNGEDGIVAYKNKKYDLVITDIRMPKKDGRDLIKFIKSIDDNQPIIVTSAYNDSHRLMELIELGIDSFLLKPISSKTFFKTIYTQVKKINLKKIEEQNLIEQAKLAQMGEMIESIAHQWKQPIASISCLAQNLNFSIEHNGKISNEEIMNISHDIEEQTKHLTKTINSFKSFFKQKGTKDIVTFGELIETLKIILKDTLLLHNIEFMILDGKEIEINCYKNEFIHILINLVNNAKDSFLDSNIELRKIFFEAKQENEIITLYIQDNAGGIKEELIENIFEQYFTTKINYGSGVGLYMCKRILDKIDGKISAKNVDMGFENGMEFMITLF